MKIIKLEINKIRGICNLTLVPNGKNMVIQGPNGAGKSAVVDALDFLLTGQISRLSGTGSFGITTAKHGKHVDCQPTESWVRAIIQPANSQIKIEIKRCMANPGKLEHDHQYDSQLLPIIEFAKREEHILTRKNLLNLITSDPRGRAEEVEALLNINNIEDIRKTLTTINNNLKDEVKSAENLLSKSEVNINSSLQIVGKFDEKEVLIKINENRLILGAEPVQNLSSSALRKNVKNISTNSAINSVYPSLVISHLDELINLVEAESIKSISGKEKELSDCIKEIKGKTQSNQLTHLGLLQLGSELIDESGRCPLCNTQFNPGELKTHISEELETLKELDICSKKITKLSEEINIMVNQTIVKIAEIIKNAQVLRLDKYAEVLKPWHKSLEELSDALLKPIENYLELSLSPSEVAQMLINKKILEVLQTLKTEISKKYPDISPEETSHDLLITLEVNVKGWEENKAQLNSAKLSQQRAEILLSSFQEARNEILSTLYDQVDKRFADLYKLLHPEESNFVAKLKPDGVGLTLSVDFHGRDLYPPNALHSEGHQDSMAICLYLALAEKLTSGIMDLIILDDVVMSIDADHRRDICKLLKNMFPQKQFLITTHDKVWYRQLQAEAVVDRSGLVEFFDWSIDGGPRVALDRDVWAKIEEALADNDVSAAASRLRNYLEQFFGEMCDKLRANIVYKHDAKWDFNELLGALISRYSDLLKTAMVSADSWDKKDLVTDLVKQSTIKSEVFAQCGLEQQSINQNIHYNEWADYQKKDFQPVVDAFQSLCQLFICPDCHNEIWLVINNHKKEDVRCECKTINWNLIPR